MSSSRDASVSDGQVDATASLLSVPFAPDPEIQWGAVDLGLALPFRYSGIVFARQFESEVVEREYIRFAFARGIRGNAGICAVYLALLVAVANPISIDFPERDLAFDVAWYLMILFTFVGLLGLLITDGLGRRRRVNEFASETSRDEEGISSVAIELHTATRARFVSQVSLTAVACLGALISRFSCEVHDPPVGTPDDRCIGSLPDPLVTMAFALIFIARVPLDASLTALTITLCTAVSWVLRLEQGRIDYRYVITSIALLALYMAAALSFTLFRCSRHRAHFEIVVAAHVARSRQKQQATILARVAAGLLPPKLSARLGPEGGATCIRELLSDESLEASVLVTDVFRFHDLEAAFIDTRQAIAGLAHLFSLFDVGATVFGVDRGMTNGDSYIVTVGLISGAFRGSARNIVRYALWQHTRDESRMLELRSAIATGRAHGSVLGTAKTLRYHIGGEAVIRAAAAVQQAAPRDLLVCDATQLAAADVLPLGVVREAHLNSSTHTSHSSSSAPLSASATSIPRFHAVDVNAFVASMTSNVDSSPSPRERVNPEAFHAARETMSSLAQSAVLETQQLQRRERVRLRRQSQPRDATTMEADGPTTGAEVYFVWFASPAADADFREQVVLACVSEKLFCAAALFVAVYHCVFLVAHVIDRAAHHEEPLLDVSGIGVGVSTVLAAAAFALSLVGKTRELWQPQLALCCLAILAFHVTANFMQHSGPRNATAWIAYVHAFPLFTIAICLRPLLSVAVVAVIQAVLMPTMLTADNGLVKLIFVFFVTVAVHMSELRARREAHRARMTAESESAEADAAIGRLREVTDGLLPHHLAQRTADIALAGPQGSAQVQALERQLGLAGDDRAVAVTPEAVEARLGTVTEVLEGVAERVAVDGFEEVAVAAIELHDEGTDEADERRDVLHLLWDVIDECMVTSEVQVRQLVTDPTAAGPQPATNIRLRVIRALGTRLVVGAPFMAGRSSHAQSVQSSLLTLHFARQLAAAVAQVAPTVRMSVVLVADEAAGAVLGYGAVRYGVFGAAVRRALEMLDALQLQRCLGSGDGRSDSGDALGAENVAPGEDAPVDQGTAATVVDQGTAAAAVDQGTAATAVDQGTAATAIPTPDAAILALPSFARLMGSAKLLVAQDHVDAFNMIARPQLGCEAVPLPLPWRVVGLPFTRPLRVRSVSGAARAEPGEIDGDAVESPCPVGDDVGTANPFAFPVE